MLLTRRKWILVLLCGGAALQGIGARAVNSRVYPLNSIIQGSSEIAAGSASAVDERQGRIALSLVNLKGDAGAHTTLLAPGSAGKLLLERVARRQPFVVFMSSKGILFGYTNGSWFRAKKEGAGWNVAEMHPEMTRTFTGPTAALVEIVKGKAPAPAPDLKAPAALGPVVSKH